jgi:hypothetical protein
MDFFFCFNCFIDLAVFVCVICLLSSIQISSAHCLGDEYESPHGIIIELMDDDPSDVNEASENEQEGSSENEEIGGLVSEGNFSDDELPLIEIITYPSDESQ